MGLEVPPESPGWEHSGTFPERTKNAIRTKAPLRDRGAPHRQPSAPSPAGGAGRHGPPGAPSPCTAAADAPESRAGRLDRFPHPQALNLFLLCAVLHQVLAPGTTCVSLSVCLSLWV